MLTKNALFLSSHFKIISLHQLHYITSQLFSFVLLVFFFLVLLHLLLLVLFYVLLLLWSQHALCPEYLLVSSFEVCSSSELIFFRKEGY